MNLRSPLRLSLICLKIIISYTTDMHVSILKFLNCHAIQVLFVEPKESDKISFSALKTEGFLHKPLDSSIGVQD